MSQPKIPSDGPQLMGSRETSLNSGPAAPALAGRELVPGPGRQASGRGSRPGIESGIGSGVRRETARGRSTRVALELPWPGPESQPVLLKAWHGHLAPGLTLVAVKLPLRVADHSALQDRHWCW